MLQHLLARGRRLFRLASRQTSALLQTPAAFATDLRGFQAQAEILSVPAFRVANVALVPVRVRNTGSQPWPAQGLQAVSLGYHWRMPNHADFLVQDDGNRSPLPAQVQPGEQIDAVCAVKAPGTFGDYELEIDLFRNLAGWFGRSDSSRRQVLVDGLRGDEIDPSFNYCDLYRGMDLTKDHWSVVGPRTPEEFRMLAQGQLGLLQEHGLTPRSRILDVGCGTGKLALSLIDSLAAEGAYVGTDLAAEAIAFCGQRYRRPNFRFLQNDMTSLPLQAETFDVIYLASVWTHMFPAEIALQLAELTRLLAPTGFMIADAFHSPRVADHTPSRGMVEINEAKLFAMFSASGLRWQRLSSHPYNSRTTRTIFKFTQPGEPAA